MKRQTLAMVLTVTSAMTDEVAKVPPDISAVVPRQHAEYRHHPSRATFTPASVCERTIHDRFDDRNISPTGAYFYQFGP